MKREREKGRKGEDQKAPATSASVCFRGVFERNNLTEREKKEKKKCVGDAGMIFPNV